MAADPDAAATADLTSHEIRQQILDRIDTSPRSMWIRASYDLGYLDGQIAERQRILDGSVPLWVFRDVVRTYEVPADLLDGDGDG